MDSSSLHKHQIHLQKLISSIVKSPLLVSCPFLLSFLNETDDAIFKKIKKEGSKVKKPGKPQEYYSVNGRLICDGLERKQEDKLINSYLQRAEMHWKKLKSLSALLISKIKETSMVIFEVGKSLEMMEETQAILSEFMPSSVPMYGSLKNLFGKWADFELESANMVSDYLYSMFKYNGKEILPFKEMIKEKDFKLSNYVKMNNKLIVKKERLWESENVSNWGISMAENVNVGELYNNKELAFEKMLYQETSDTDKCKNEFAFLNYQIKAELARLLNQNQSEELAHFSEFSKTFSEHLIKLHLFMGDLLASLSQLKHESK